MSKASPILAAYNGGEFSPLLSARTDLDKRGKGLALCREMVPLIQGAVTRRPGSYYVGPVKNESTGAWFIPFRFSSDQAYVLEFGAAYIRFWRDYGQVVTDDIAITGAVDNGAGLIRLTATAHGMETGWTATVASVGGVPTATGTWTITVINANTIDLQGSTFAGLYTSGGTITGIVQVTTTYALADLPDLTYVQQGDVLYFAHQGYQPRKLSRLSNVSWTLETLDLEEGPFQKINADDAVSVQASAITGAGITLTATGGDVFLEAMVGALFYLEAEDAGGVKPWETSRAISSGDFRRNDGKYYEAQNNETTGPVAPVHTEGDFNDGGGASNGILWRFLHAGYGWVRITAYTSATQVTAEVIWRLPAIVVSSGTYKWAKPAFYDGNWPGTVTFFQQRLAFAGTPLQPDTAWLSVASDFENFAAKDRGGRIVADQAATLTLASNEVNDVRWMASDARGLLLGTVGAEHVIGAASQSEGFGPNNAKATPQSSWGSARIQPARVGAATLMVEAGARTVRELIYSFDADRYAAVDLLVLASHFTEAVTITQIAWQQKPHSILWCVLSDGTLLGITYNREQQVIGAHLHDVGGIVESIAVIPAPELIHDDLWLLVQRTIDGNTRRYVEFLTPFFSSHLEQDEAVFLDCALTYDGWNATTTKTMTLSGVGTWVAGQSKTLTAAGHTPFAGGDVGKRYRIRDGLGFYGEQVDVEITAYTSSTVVTVTLLGACPASLQAVASSDWALLSASLSGLDHLEAEEVSIAVDGATHPARTVASGAVSLARYAARAHVGLPIAWRLKTLQIEAGAQDGTAQGKLKRVNQVTLRLHQSGGFRLGGSEDVTDRVELRTALHAQDRAIPLYSGDLARPLRSGHDRNGQVYLEGEDPLPFTLVAMMPQLKTEDRA